MYDHRAAERTKAYLLMTAKQLDTLNVDAHYDVAAVCYGEAKWGV